MGKKLKLIALLLTMILAFVVVFAMPAFAQETDGEESSSVENVTDVTEPEAEPTTAPEDAEVPTDPEVPTTDPEAPVTLFLMGDLDRNGTVDAGDARLILRYSVGLDNIDSSMIAYADIETNGAITAGDARLALRISVSLAEAEQHALVNGEIAEATCSTNGSVTYTCEHCELAGTIVTEKLAHAYETVSHTAATCTADGADAQKCSACGDEREVVLKATGHKYMESERKDADCTNKGYIKNECTACGEMQTIEIKAKGHSYNETKNQAATCTDAGVIEYTCSVCSNVLSMPSSALGHQMVRCTATTPQHCSRCNEKYTGVQQAATGLYYYYTKSGNTYSCAKNQIVGSSYYGPDGARVDGDDAIDAAVNFVNTYTNASASAYSRLQTSYNIFYQYFTYGTNADLTATPDGRYLPGFCVEFFEDVGGNCFRFASALAYVARVLGFDSGFISGQISASGGGTTTHGLTTVKYNGTTYWCDAMMQTKYPSTNTFMVTKSSYPYGYTANYSCNMSVANGKVTWSS